MRKVPNAAAPREGGRSCSCANKALIARSGDEQEIKRVHKQLIDAEDKHDLAAVRALVWDFSFRALRRESSCGFARLLGHFQQGRLGVGLPKL